MRFPWRRQTQDVAFSVILYSRQGCCLCDEALELLNELAPRYGYTVEVVNVDGDPALANQYGHRIPVVVLPDGQTLAAPIDERALRRALEAAR